MRLINLWEIKVFFKRVITLLDNNLTFNLFSFVVNLEIIVFQELLEPPPKLPYRYFTIIHFFHIENFVVI